MNSYQQEQLNALTLVREKLAQFDLHSIPGLLHIKQKAGMGDGSCRIMPHETPSQGSDP